MESNNNLETYYVYWRCDKVGCNKKNQRKINAFIRRDDEPIAYSVYNDDRCDKCDEEIHEPLFVRYDPFKVINER